MWKVSKVRKRREQYRFVGKMLKSIGFAYWIYTIATRARHQGVYWYLQKCLMMWKVSKVRKRREQYSFVGKMLKSIGSAYWIYTIATRALVSVSVPFFVTLCLSSHTLVAWINVVCHCTPLMRRSIFPCPTSRRVMWGRSGEDFVRKFWTVGTVTPCRCQT